MVQDGDLGTWDKPRILLILEGPCCELVTTPQGRLRKTQVLAPAEDWKWHLTTVKCVMRWSFNSHPVEVITFHSQEAADMAAEWFNRYDVEVASVTYYKFSNFTRSLSWRRNNIQEIVDTSMERANNYGQLGRLILPDGEF